jgi:DNA repair exonuclease SbcCD nuclease subunit
MRSENVIAILCADIHLSQTAPIWRSAEPDWYEAMKRPLDELKELQAQYNCPIFCAGDVFHQWNSPAELINFALDYLPTMYAIPGQHDLPNHSINEMERSAFWTLVKADKIKLLNYGEENWDDCAEHHIAIWGFPYGNEIQQINRKNQKRVCLAIAHEYKWISGHSFKGADSKDRIARGGKWINNKWNGYDVVVYGDNHSAFTIKQKNTTFFNCGSLMRRHSDQLNYKPMVGLLTKRGEIFPYLLDISQDKSIPVEQALIKEDSEMDMTEFMKDLSRLGDSSLDFAQALCRFCNKHKVRKPVKRIIDEVVHAS